MTRIEFTGHLRELLNFAHYTGIAVHVDYVKRSEEEQRRMVEKGVSWTEKGRHPVGKAVDVHVYREDGRIEWDDPA